MGMGRKVSKSLEVEVNCMAKPTSPKLISEFNKNSTEIIRIQLTEFVGKQFLNVRVWALRQDGEYVPTKKGLTLRVEQVDDLLEGINKAAEELEKAQEQG